MRAHHADLEAHALAQNQCQNQTAEARADMNSCTAGEVDGSNRVLVADKARAPHHMGHRGVHHHRPHHQNKGQGAELHAARQGTGDDGRSNHGECRLKRYIDQTRVRAHRYIGIRGVLWHRSKRIEHLRERPRREHPIEATDEQRRCIDEVSLFIEGIRAAVGNGIAENRPKAPHHAHRHHAHEHSVHDVLPS